MRHNAVLARIETAIAYRGTILSENQAIGPNHLRPDLVAEIDATIYIVDVTVPFENRRDAFRLARERKTTKYQELIPLYKNQGYQDVQIVPIVVGSLGAWDPENDLFLKKVATRSYLAVLRKLCVSECIRWSRDIYVQHLTGAQQYSTTSNAIPLELPSTTEAIVNSNNSQVITTIDSQDNRDTCSTQISQHCQESSPTMEENIVDL
ncbi:retrovirus-related Pol polyprotein from type-1 retrotransposable element R2 [Trichonephila clavata]|uniref:Retrovirus-related Pol polyprotein from type-1 retrotransposable element R2 n=1 Tax=Trichonephila clavata TaxID=2740835 RepID=A0A8X6IRQ9_TRICU|nr:retrovirus-related Pol polyprotein from type-1 retrotransposable element R2 [Trichonephila clavata]